MAVIVGVHGIAQELKGPTQLRDEWTSALSDGLRHARADLPRDGLECAFYGDLFRQKGSTRAAAGHYRVEDVTDEEAELLFQLWEEAASSERNVVSPDAAVRGTPKGVQASLRALSRSRFLTNMAQSAFIGALKQVTGYMNDPRIRDEAQASVHEVVTEETRVLLGHSLGSVVAYEALHRYQDDPAWANVGTLVTLGSPLGISNLIFQRLDPEPSAGRGAMPRVDRWTNISDDGDIVALVKELKSLFGNPLVDVRVHNGATVHDIRPYLSAGETGRAIAPGLSLPQ